MSCQGRATDYDDDVNVLACKLSWAWRAWSASRKCFTWSNQPKVSKVAPRVAFRSISNVLVVVKLTAGIELVNADGSRALLRPHALRYVLFFL